MSSSPMSSTLPSYMMAVPCGTLHFPLLWDPSITTLSRTVTSPTSPNVPDIFHPSIVYDGRVLWNSPLAPTSLSSGSLNTYTISHCYLPNISKCLRPHWHCLAVNIFHPSIVIYDGHAGYSPCRPLHLPPNPSFLGPLTTTLFHTPNIFVPNIFHPSIVYDGRALAAPRPTTSLFRCRQILAASSEMRVPVDLYILESLTCDPRPVANNKRPLRSTGVALSVTVGLLETTYPNTGARIILFAGGPATEGPGMVVSNELKEPIRSHHEIGGDNVKHYKRANKVCTLRLCLLFSLIIVFQFYEGQAVRASNNGHAIDLFGGCLDQVGHLEMRSLPNSTNGIVLLSDSFTTAIFKQSFLRVFNKDGREHLSMGFNATFNSDVQVSFFFTFNYAYI